MRILLQRVSSASVVIDGGETRRIGRGLVLLAGIKKGDRSEMIPRLADKIIGLRIFPNESGKFDRSLQEINGEVLIVSQFTLYANYARGRRPDFLLSAVPEEANPIYEGLVTYFRDKGLRTVTGTFGADMKVAIHNDGPVTIMIDSDELSREA